MDYRLPSARDRRHCQCRALYEFLTTSSILPFPEMDGTLHEPGAGGGAISPGEVCRAPAPCRRGCHGPEDLSVSKGPHKTSAAAHIYPSLTESPSPSPVTA